MTRGPGRLPIALLGFLLWTVTLPSPMAWAGSRPSPLSLSIRLVTADGASVDRVSSYGALRLVTPGSAGSEGERLALSLDGEGRVALSLRRPGAYGLVVMGIPVARFKVVPVGDDLQADGLPETVKLPFTHVLEISPPRRLERYLDPRTGKERTRLVPVSVDWSKARVGRAGKEPTGKVWPTEDGRYRAGLAAPGGGAAAVLVPGCAPVVVPLRELPPNQAGDLSRRKVGARPMPVSFDPDKPGEVAGIPAGRIYNVERRIFWWLSRARVKDQDQWFLCSYRLEDGMGTVDPLHLPEAPGRWSEPRPYLDEKGDLHLFRRVRTPEGGSTGECFKLGPGGEGRAAAACIYPRFSFHGQVYGDRGTWIVPNIGGVPLQVGSNPVSISAVAELGGRTTGVAHTYTLEVEGPVPHVTGEVPFTRCTGSPPGGGEDDRWCLDPPVDPAFVKGPAPTPPPGCTEDKACMEKFQKETLPAWAHYHPEPPCYADLVSGRASFGGVDMDYAAPQTFGSCFEEGPDGTCLHSAERKIVLSGLPPLRPEIQLVVNQMGWVDLKGPLNLREGPYPSLRYEARRVDPATGKRAARTEVVELYPWNYRVRAEGRRIIVDRSDILKPTPPPAEEGEEARPGALLEVLSPSLEETHELEGPEAEIRIRFRYELAGADPGELRVSVEHESGVLERRSYPLPAPAGEREIALRVKRPKGSPRIGVGLELLEPGQEEGPGARLYYAFAVGAFTVEVEPESPMAADPKNLTEITLTLRDAGGSPVADRELDVSLKAPGAEWVKGGYLQRPGGSSERVTTDGSGRVRLLYIPPRAAMSPLGAPLGTFPVGQELEVRDTADSARSARATIELVSPWPRITGLALPGGDPAGQWQGSPSRVVVTDADSRSFHITVYGAGEFGYEGGHGRQQKLEVFDATSPFLFRFKSRPMGLDLGNIPSDWEMFKAFGETNAKVLGRLAMLMGGKWLLRQHAVTGTPATVTHTSQVTRISGGGDELGGMVGKLGSDIDTTVITKVKIMTTFKNALPQATWATEMMEDADATISITKNMTEVANAIGQSRLDTATAGNMGPVHDLDAALDGLHAGVGVVDTLVTVKDLVTSSPMNLEVELVKGVYENAKTFYAIHRKFQTVADSWEDLTFVPILVEVADGEGHRARRLGRLAVKFSREMGD